MTLSELKVENSAELSNGDGSEDKKPAATVNPVAAPPTPELSEDSNRKDTAPLLVSSPVARAAAPPATSAPSMTPTAFTTPARHGGLGQSGETETILRILSTVLEQQNTAAKAHAAELAEAAKTHAAQLAEAEKAHAAQLAEAEKAHAAQLAEAEKAHAAERAEDRNLVAHITNAHAAERAESEKAHAAQLAEAEKLLSEFAALMETYEKNRAEEIKAALTREAFARQGSAALSGVQVQASRTSQVEASTQRWTAPLTKQGNPCTKCKPERYCCDTHKQQHDF
jgi:flagellar biosynthesis GTPase FlhF